MKKMMSLYGNVILLADTLSIPCMLLSIIGGLKQVWKIFVSYRLHIFLCLLANNKVLTRDNQEKGGKLRIKHVYSVMKLNM
jgi:hypothetical protein